ncbi:hypothetical protein FB451DRAFT_1173113 [Mycena latifolia]|nr:hypothetical protein FB451DRAFT_1173113 [Mycena latifolia]
MRPDTWEEAHRAQLRPPARNRVFPTYDRGLPSQSAHVDGVRIEIASTRGQGRKITATMDAALPARVVRWRTSGNLSSLMSTNRPVYVAFPRKRAGSGAMKTGESCGRTCTSGGEDGTAERAILNDAEADPRQGRRVGAHIQAEQCEPSPAADVEVGNDGDGRGSVYEGIAVCGMSRRVTLSEAGCRVTADLDVGTGREGSWQIHRRRCGVHPLFFGEEGVNLREGRAATAASPSMFVAMDKGRSAIVVGLGVNQLHLRVGDEVN